MKTLSTTRAIRRPPFGSMREPMKTILGGVLAASLLVSPAFAQSSSGTWNGLSDRFRIDAGYFGLTATTVLTLQRRRTSTSRRTSASTRT